MSRKFKMIMCTNAVRFHKEHVPFVAPKPTKKKNFFFIETNFIQVDQCTMSSLQMLDIFWIYEESSFRECNIHCTYHIFENKEIKQGKWRKAASKLFDKS